MKPYRWALVNDDETRINFTSESKEEVEQGILTYGGEWTKVIPIYKSLLPEEQKKALNALIQAIGTLPQSRMEFAACAIMETGIKLETKARIVDDFQTLGKAQADLMDAFGWKPIP